jgi:hypothetical protein
MMSVVGKAMSHVACHIRKMPVVKQNGNGGGGWL